MPLIADRFFVESQMPRTIDLASGEPVYLVVTTAYSLYLKRQPVADVFTLTGIRTV